MRPNIPNSLLSDQDRQRLVAVLNLLASDKHGERDAAANAATRFLRNRDLQWDDIIIRAAELEPEQQRADDVLADWPEHWRRAIDLCLRSAQEISPGDRQFVAAISQYSRRPSDKQLNWLHRIVDDLLSGKRKRRPSPTEGEGRRHASA